MNKQWNDVQYDAAHDKTCLKSTHKTDDIFGGTAG